FSSQNEWLWVVQGGNGWFFYSWTELDVRPWRWLRLGIVTERTRLFQTAREFIFGPLVGFTVWKVDFSFFWFQPGRIDPTFALKLELPFCPRPHPALAARRRPPAADARGPSCEQSPPPRRATSSPSRPVARHRSGPRKTRRRATG